MVQRITGKNHQKKSKVRKELSQSHAHQPILAEPLESRVLLAAALEVQTLVNVSQFLGNQTEATIAIDPSNASHLFIASNTGDAHDPDFGSEDPIPGDEGLFAAFSTDSGVTWTTSVIADGSDSLEPACCDPSAAFDDAGNLYLTYINSATDKV